MDDAPFSPSPSGEGLGWGRTLVARARRMRREPTEPEKRLWRHLSNSQLNCLKFRRQAVIASYIADFFCPSLGLIIEVDGDTHDPEKDRGRDQEMARIGFRTVRVTNEDVMRNIDGVLTAILAANTMPERKTWRLPHPNPSPEGEGL